LWCPRAPDVAEALEIKEFKNVLNMQIIQLKILDFPGAKPPVAKIFYSPDGTIFDDASKSL
jgi:hypothetical protein